jgi:hypothetical protein
MKEAKNQTRSLMPTGITPPTNKCQGVRNKGVGKEDIGIKSHDPLNIKTKACAGTKSLPLKC